MKTKHLIPVLATSALLALNFNVLAHDGGDDGGNDSSNECHINGQETMDAVVTLVATANAPDGATGVAKIESDNEDGNETASLEIRTMGLTPGDYDLSITLLPADTNSTGTNIDLGFFTVGNGDEDDDGGDDHGGDGFHSGGEGEGGGGWVGCCWGGFTNWGCWTNWTGFTNTCASWTNSCGQPDEPPTSKIETDLPVGVNPTDIGEITISDTNGNPILVGDLVAPVASTVINISATVQLAPGAAAPSANGTARIQSTASKGKWKHQFSLVASGVDPKSTFKMKVNGKVSGAMPRAARPARWPSRNSPRTPPPSAPCSCSTKTATPPPRTHF